MRMLLALGTLLLTAVCYSAPRLEVWPVDALDKVFPDDAAGTHRAQPQAWLIPRNGHATVQFAVRSTAPVDALSVRATSGGGLKVEVRHVGYVPVGSNPPGTPYDEVLRPAPALFPDPLFENFPYALAAGRTEAVWITLYAPADTKPGVYSGEAVFEAGGQKLASAPFQVRVVEAAVPARRTLKVTNWFNTGESALDQHYKLRGNAERYWELMGNIGRVMADHGQNVILTPVFELSTPRIEGDRLVYDFSRLDRWVETFEKAGLIGTIEGGHLLSRVSGYTTPLMIPAYVIEDGKAVQRGLNADDPRAEQFLDSYLTALYAHLKERGWAERYIQHIHDEPHDAETSVYNRYGKIIRRNLPGVQTVDAVGLDQDLGFLDVTDIWVPVLSTFDHQMDKLRDHVGKGGQAWFYTCISPQGRYLNRFIDLPLLKTRLLHWMNFRYDFTGFLHWGGNYWGPEPFANVQSVINDNQTLLPAGDNAIVYPNPEKNSVLSSLRLEAMREGIEEYELLAALAKSDPQKAQRLAAEAIPHFNDYVRDTVEFRRLQAQLLGVEAPARAARPAKPAPLAPAQANLSYWLVDGLEKVFPGDAVNARRLEDPTLHAARNSNASLQLALRADGRALGDVYVDALPLTGPGIPIETASVRTVEYVVVTTNTTETPREELVAEAPALFPDALMSKFPLTLERAKTRTVWVTINVPPDQAPGEYRGELRVRQGRDEVARVPYQLIVHRAAVPERIPLTVTNHFYFGSDLVQQTYGVTYGSGEWWGLVANFARFLGSYHQSSIVTSPIQMVKAEVSGGGLRFDFSDYERFVSLFQSAGVDRHFEGGDLLTRERRRGAPLMMRAWVNENGRAVLRTLPYQDERAREFLDAYLPALGEMLARHNWNGKYLQGVLDEPHEGEHEAFAEVAALVRKRLPGVRMIEPVGARQDLSFMKNVDIWTLQLGTFDDQRLEELRRHAAGGGELWLYTALDPVGKYPNRFIDYSLEKVRILHWMNYRYGFGGFLHWGGNYWGPEPLLDTQPV
ncbi:MAG TPA: DUF4091 domain-containing protein, partial [Bryobacteraceae bacterium]|nr:DUF4091 domain-containing protein [Bryobacteraceae bacterium]